MAGGAIGNYINIAQIRNPKTGGHIINYGIDMIVLPSIMIGVTIGSLMSKEFPQFVLSALLFATLFYNFWHTFKKMVHLIKLRKELDRMKNEEEAAKALQALQN